MCSILPLLNCLGPPAQVRLLVVCHDHGERDCVARPAVTAMEHAKLHRLRIGGSLRGSCVIRGDVLEERVVDRDDVLEERGVSRTGCRSVAQA